jgi:hypothetical protein
VGRPNAPRRRARLLRFVRIRRREPRRTAIPRPLAVLRRLPPRRPRRVGELLPRRSQSSFDQGVHPTFAPHVNGVADGRAKRRAWLDKTGCPCERLLPRQECCRLVLAGSERSPGGDCGTSCCRSLRPERRTALQRLLSVAAPVEATAPGKLQPFVPAAAHAFRWPQTSECRRWPCPGRTAVCQ